MTEFNIQTLLVLLLLIALTVFNFLNARGKNRKVVIAANVTLFALIGGVFTVYTFDAAAEETDGKKYNVSGSTILSALCYKEEDGDYYYFTKSALFTSGTIAVPKENAQLPPPARTFTHVRLYSEDGAPEPEHTTLTNGRYAFLYDSVVKIESDISYYALCCCIVLIPLFALFNFVEFFICLGQMIREIKADKAAGKEAKAVETEKGGHL